jgi:hypothetical protein
MNRNRYVLVAVTMALFAAEAAYAQRVNVPRERLSRVATDSALRAPVAVVTHSGIDTVHATSAGLQLQRGEFAVLGAMAGIRQVAGPPAVQGMAAQDSVAIEAAAPFWSLPIVLVTPDSALTGEWVLRPIYKVVEPMRWQPDSGRFRGSFFFALEDTVRPRESRPVVPAIPFALLGDVEVAPAELAVAHTNLPLQRVVVLARDAADSVRVHVVPGSELGGRDLWIPVERAITVTIEPRRIQGWGIQTAKVVTRVLGTSVVRPVTASISATRGSLDSSRFQIDESGAGEVRMRSGGLGQDTVEVFVAGIGRVTQTAEVTLPWIFLLAALLGGVFGGLGAAAHNKQGRRKTRWREYAIKGVFGGLLAALAWYALGINLLHLDVGIVRFNELAVFTLAALAGFFGIPTPKAAADGRAAST